MLFVRSLERIGTINVPGSPSISDREVALSSRRNILLIMRRFLAFGALWVVLLPQVAASATPPTLEEAERWISQHGIGTLCAPLTQNPWSAAVGFGAATLAAGWIGRRRNLKKR